MDNLFHKLAIAVLTDRINALDAENNALKELNEQYLNWLPASYYICNKDTNERS